MKNRLFVLLVVVALLMSVFAGSASAQAYTAHFTTSITYVNVGTDTTKTLDLYFYASADDTAPTTYSLQPLAKGAAASLFVGGLSTDVVAAGFQGDAVMQSDQPMLVTLVQIPMDAGNVKNRALSNGFSEGQKGPQTLIATVLKHMFGSNTKFSVQNADGVTDTVTIAFYNTSAVKVLQLSQDIEPGASFYVDAAALAGLPDPFNGSAVVSAVKKVGGTAGAVVSSVMELDYQSTGLKAFEGVATGATQLFMASAICNYRGQNTSYAVQNASLTDDTDVTVTFKDTAGHSYPITKNIGPGAKASFAGCEAGALPNNTLGSAIVTSSATDIIAFGKAYGAGLSTAFNGVVSGDQKIALPYVRWGDDAKFAAGVQQRTYITIQNVGATIPAGAVITIEYKNPEGVTQGTHTYTVPTGGLANGAKINSTATNAGLATFGYYGSIAGGAAIITGPDGSQLTAVARVSTQASPGVYMSEDYNSQAITTP